MRLDLYINMAKATPNDITLLQDYLYDHSIASLHLHYFLLPPKVL